MPQLTNDTSYPPISLMLPDDKFVLSTTEGVRKLLLSALRVPADQVLVDDSLYEELEGSTLGEILTFLDEMGAGGGVNLDPPTLVTFEATDEQPDTSWFGDGSLWKFFEFSVTSTDDFAAVPPEIVSGAANSGGAVALIFPATDFIGGTIQASANIVDFYVEDYRPQGKSGLPSYVTSLPVGNYVLAVGLWDVLDVGTVIDVSALLYSLSSIATVTPDPGTPYLPFYPLGVDDTGAVRPFFPVLAMDNPPRWPGTLSLGRSNTVEASSGIAVGYDNSVITDSSGTAFGNNNIVSGSEAMAFGFSHIVDQQYGIALGVSGRPRWEGALAFCTANMSPQGYRQTEWVHLHGTGSVRLGPNTPLPASKVAHVTASVVTRTNDGATVKAWRVELVVATDSTAVHRVVGTPTKTVIAGDAGAAGWDLTVAVDNNGLSFTPTGVTAGERTMASVEFTEI